MRGITKSFAGVPALRGVDLEVLPGEVHCVLGQNGAGKSTLIKILSGAYQPDGGEIIWQGQPATIPSPTAALGIGHRDHVPGARRRRRPDHHREHLPRPRAVDGRRAAHRRREPPRPRPARPARPRRPQPVARGRHPVGREQADRQHGARPVARHPPHRHGRAERGARLRRGQEPLPRRRGADVARASPSSTSPTGSTRSARSATASPSSRTAAAWPAACPSPTPRPRS